MNFLEHSYSGKSNALYIFIGKNQTKKFIPDFGVS